MNWLVGLLLVTLAVSGASGLAVAQPYQNSVTFELVDDPAIAVDMVRTGALDMYYYGVPPELLDGEEGMRDLLVYTAPGGVSYSLLLNPADGDAFNPFQIREVRFAVNYLVDRQQVVDALLGGYGSQMVSYVAPFEPDYLGVIEQVESFGFHYNPELAGQMIHDAMMRAGATLDDGVWTVDGVPVEVVMFIRDDDPVRHSLGESLAGSLEGVGFAVVRTYGDLRGAITQVYGEDPGKLGWHLYTEGWGGSGISNYDDSSLGAFYAPIRGTMPGSGNPSFWNYEHAQLDEIARQLSHGEYGNEEERSALLQAGVIMGVEEAVRVFVASRTELFVVNDDITGVVSDVGEGITDRLTPINVQGGGSDLSIGVRYLSQSSWNPVGGYTDVYSNDIATLISDPAAFGHPHTGDIIPARTEWSVTTAGPDGVLSVPEDAVVWDPFTQRWESVGTEATATSMVVLDYEFGNWHHGRAMDMNDILYRVYFLYEWGTITGEDDSTVDAEYTHGAQLALEELVGVRQVDEDTLEVYIDYWHFDESEIALSGIFWTGTPWEMYYAMERLVRDGDAAFSRSVAGERDVNWLSLINPDDTEGLQRSLIKSIAEDSAPSPLREMNLDDHYLEMRYWAAAGWMAKRGHAAVSNGPFYLEAHGEQTARLSAFRDDSYPFVQGMWSQFGDPAYPEVLDVQASQQEDRGHVVSVTTTGATTLRYFVSGPEDGVIHSGTQEATGEDTINIPPTNACSITLRIFALPPEAGVPAIHETILADCP